MRPICCRAFDSSPASPRTFDSFEPFWMNQIVARIKSENWRNSDCQFSITEPPKSVEVTYDHQETGEPPCSALTALYLFLPANDWPTSVIAKIARKKRESPFSRTYRLIQAARSTYTPRRRSR